MYHLHDSVYSYKSMKDEIKILILSLYQIEFIQNETFTILKFNKDAF